jgi:hypothetical protein
MDKRLKTTLTAAVVSLVFEPVIVALIGAGLGWVVMGEVVVIDIFIVISIMVIGMAE